MRLITTSRRNGRISKIRREGQKHLARRNPRSRRNARRLDDKFRALAGPQPFLFARHRHRAISRGPSTFHANSIPYLGAEKCASEKGNLIPFATAFHWILRILYGIIFYLCK